MTNVFRENTKDPDNGMCTNFMAPFLLILTTIQKTKPAELRTLVNCSANNIYPQAMCVLVNDIVRVIICTKVLDQPLVATSHHRWDVVCGFDGELLDGTTYNVVVKMNISI